MHFTQANLRVHLSGFCLGQAQIGPCSYRMLVLESETRGITNNSYIKALISLFHAHFSSFFFSCTIAIMFLLSDAQFII